MYCLYWWGVYICTFVHVRHPHVKVIRMYVCRCVHTYVWLQLRSRNGVYLYVRAICHLTCSAASRMQYVHIYSMFVIPNHVACVDQRLASFLGFRGIWYLLHGKSFCECQTAQFSMKRFLVFVPPKQQHPGDAEPARHTCSRWYRFSSSKPSSFRPQPDMPAKSKAPPPPLDSPREAEPSLTFQDECKAPQEKRGKPKAPPPPLDSPREAADAQHRGFGTPEPGNPKVFGPPPDMCAKPRGPPPKLHSPSEAADAQRRGSANPPTEEPKYFKPPPQSHFDLSSEMRPGGLFTQRFSAPDVFNDTSTIAYWWNQLSRNQVARLQIIGITDEDDWNLHPASGVVRAILGRLWYSAKLQLSTNSNVRPQMDVFPCFETGSQNTGLDVTLNVSFLDGCMLMIEASLKALLKYFCDIVNPDPRSIQMQLQRMPLRNQNVVILFIMGMLKRAGADQPRLFIEYVRWLDLQVGWYSCLGPLRRFISNDPHPISHQEHDAMEDWLVKTGVKSEPNYKIISIDGDAQVRVDDPREVYFLDEQLDTAGNSSASRQQAHAFEVVEC